MNKKLCAYLAVFFFFFFFWRNWIYRKCKNVNASVSIYGSHAKISCILYARQTFSATFWYVITAQMPATVLNIVLNCWLQYKSSYTLGLFYSLKYK